jgi:hypothetical protein
MNINEDEEYINLDFIAVISECVTTNIAVLFCSIILLTSSLEALVLGYDFNLGHVLTIISAVRPI